MNGPAYTERFDDAMALTLHAFRDTFRKATPVPYLTHLLAVTALVGEHGGDEDQLIAALLHDYLEDVPESTPAELADRFGERVAMLVTKLSDTIVHPKPPWLERKQGYLSHLAGEHPDVKLISAADKLHNSGTLLRDHRVMGDAIFDRFKPTKEQTLWYYRSCLSALRDGWEHPILGELEATLRELHRRAGADWPTR